MTHDVLNNVINRVDLHNQNVAEIVCAYRNVPHAHTNAIYIYDRHYASFALAYLHFRHGSDYVIRMKTEGGSTMVSNFLQSAKKQQVIKTALHTGRAFYKLQELGLNPERHAEFPARLVRVELDDGTVEVLMTSLIDYRRYPHHEFKWLYSKRWGVETAIFVLKSFLQIALFSAYTQPGVEQDLWATFAFYNQQSAVIAACEEEVKLKTGSRKYEYRINRNVTAGLIVQFLPDIYLGGRAKWRARTLVLLKLMPQFTEPYRPDRSRARERKIMRMNNRHIHEKNYRKAM
ncbi:MAG: transposase [Bacteroidota bacterium]